MATSELRFGTYVWDAVNDKCYAEKPKTIDALKDSIREAIGEIELPTNDNVLKNWTDRVGYCMASRGSHLNEIIFHYKPEGLKFFLKHFLKKKVFGGPSCTNF